MYYEPISQCQKVILDLKDNLFFKNKYFFYILSPKNSFLCFHWIKKNAEYFLPQSPKMGIFKSNFLLYKFLIAVT